MSDLENHFPRLRGADYRITSPPTDRFNCLAWAAGDTTQWWQPTAPHYWPPTAPRDFSLAACAQAYAALGYTPCEGEEPEQGFEKIALFADEEGLASHAARQLPEGRWSSKIGQLEDIEHNLHDLTGTLYGKVAQILKRPRPNAS